MALHDAVTYLTAYRLYVLMSSIFDIVKKRIKIEALLGLCQ